MKSFHLLPVLALAGLAACQDAPLAPEQQKSAPSDRTLSAPPSSELRTGWIYGPDGEPLEVTFTVFEGWAIFEGDINLGRADQIAETRDALVRSGGPRYGVFINGSSYRWPNGTVPYVIDASFDSYQRQTIIDAMNHVANTAAGVSFRQRTNETAYVVFAKHTSVCNSPVGKQGSSQTINLTGGCAYSMGTVAHEVLHTMGMWHEQSRCDRDSYITVDLNNVLTADRHNFDKKCTGNTSVVAYNEGSIMHYGTHDFSYNGGQVLTSRRGLDYLMGQRSGLAQSDASTVNYIYRPYTPWVQSVAADANGNAVATWNALPGATHYTFTRIERYEFYDNWVGTSRTQEYRGGTVTVYGNSIADGTYSGNSTCVTYDTGYETEQWVYEWEIQAYFPDGITSYVGRSSAPIGNC